MTLLSSWTVQAGEAAPPPAAIRDGFFEKYRTHGKQGGTGLGTYSARLMAEVMGYGIGMETSDAENSTCVWLRIPRP